MNTGKRHGLILLLATLAASGSAAAAPTSYLEDAGVVAFGKTIDVSRLPVTTSKGAIIYKDIVINLSVDALGNVTFAAKPTVTASPTPIPSNFIAGRYYLRYFGTNYFGDLTKGVGAGASTIWTLTMEQASGGSWPEQSIWQTGTPAPDVASRLNTAMVRRNPNYSYGTTPEGGNAVFSNNGLLAAEQVNTSLTLVSYSGNTGDQQLPVGSIIFALCANAACTNAPH